MLVGSYGASHRNSHNGSMTLVVEFLGEPDTTVAESVNRARLRMLGRIERLARLSGLLV